MTTKTSQAYSLKIERHIKAARKRVYEAWANPEQLKQWFGPANVQTHQIIADVRPGGEFRWDLENSDGEKMTMHGEYREVQPNRKIVLPGAGTMMSCGRIAPAL
jgi:uncharacterized protein YndB with AHSA1/START domain